MFLREMEMLIKESISKISIIAILGPRQSGKTTLARKAFPNFSFVSLEDLEERTFVEDDPKYFLQSHSNKEGLIIDEIQYAPGLFSYLQVIVDNPENKHKFIITGSQNFLLNKKISQSLAGRCLLFTLLPMNIIECKRANLIPEQVETLLIQGCYPRIWKQQLNPNLWYQAYIQSYIERDVRMLKNIDDLGMFQHFLKLCAARVGSILNYEDLSRDAGITIKTIKSWLTILEASYILFRLEPHYQNFGKRVIKAPKIYFYDTGIVCNLLGIENEQQLHTHYLRGNIFESFIISEFIKKRLNQGLKSNAYFWKDQKGHEVDLIIEKANTLIPIEIKSGTTLLLQWFKNLKYYCQLTNTPNHKAFIIYNGPRFEQRKDGVVASWKLLDQVFTAIHL